MARCSLGQSAGVVKLSFVVAFRMSGFCERRWFCKLRQSINRTLMRYKAKIESSKFLGRRFES